MIYLKRFLLPSELSQELFVDRIRATCHDSFYPFGVLFGKGLEALEFSHVTLLSGGNGTGKTTLLALIADAVGAKRVAPGNASSFWGDFVERCEAQFASADTAERAFIRSDDVFDHILDLRRLNLGLDRAREERFREWNDRRHAGVRLRSMADFDELRLDNLAKRSSYSRFTRETLMDAPREFSNGEAALRYFLERTGENGLYLLDEPENSLSPENQLRLRSLICDAARYLRCQFIISTHSPLLLSIPGAQLYDLDAEPCRTCRWTELAHVRVWYDFFREHSPEFDPDPAP